MKKTVLITGGAGYLGSVLTGVFLNLGYEVTVVDNFLFGASPILNYLNRSNFSYEKADITDAKTLIRVMKKYNTVCHLAALVGEPACTDKKETLKINYLATKNLLKLAEENGVDRFIFASSCSNYGIMDTRQEAEEDFPLNPISVYAESKVLSENVIIKFRSKKLTTTILRFGTMYGISPRMRFNLLVNFLVREAFYQREVEIVNPQVWRPYISVADATRVIVSISGANKEKVGGEIFNIVGENLTKLELVRKIQKEFPKFKPKFVQTNKVDQRDYRVSAHKFQTILNFKYKDKISDTIPKIAEALKDDLFDDPYAKKYNAWK